MNVSLDTDIVIHLYTEAPMLVSEPVPMPMPMPMPMLVSEPGCGGVEFMPEAPFGRSTRWLTALTVDPQQCGVSRDDIIDALEEENIEARPVWKPMHLQPLYEGCRYYPHAKGNSVSDRLFEQGLCLPSGSNLTEQDQDRVIKCLRRCLGRERP